ncbi:RluA family pseudouridine synthase [Verticiella sediminum]|uniref:Pseudouridine synthase n=1 Tax=Verticiella sediminum TaxID=1247510 RepID=A0A556ACN7_9BURK|nr:RluA family pseudouridine synthase [Verticiella sediminum]TSH90633.1 RluA family pseudouridine synthase [Verticiella sediminum]
MLSDAAPDDEDGERILDVPAGCAGRLDKVLAELIPEHSRARLQGWIEAGHVKVNGRVAASVRQRVATGDVLAVQEQAAPEQLAYTAEPVEFEVVAESTAWIVVDKPAGLVVHPGAGNWGGTLLNGLLHRYPELAHVARAGIVHRLDKDTSGLLVVARTEQAQTALVRQLQARTVGREYLALAHGWPRRAGTVERSIGRDPRVPVRMAVDRPIAPKPAITHYEPLREGLLGKLRVAAVACRLETGRTHQIRVHMASLGHPLLGDVLYGGKLLEPAARQMLHARRLRFDDPQTGEPVAFESALPDDMLAVEAAIAWQGQEDDDLDDEGAEG